MNVRTVILILMMLVSLDANAAGDICTRIAEMANGAKAQIPAYMSGRKVIGKGRAYFYTAPDERCRDNRTYVIPGDRVEAYADLQKFTLATYWSSNGNDVSGWILSTRLAETGTGIGPKAEHK